MKTLLNPVLARCAMDMVAIAIEAVMKTTVLKRPMMHLVIARLPVGHLPDFGMWTQNGSIFMERTINDKKDGEWDFEMFARRKAFASCRTGKSMDDLLGAYRHLLMFDDCRFTGSVVDNELGLVFAASGVQQAYDTMAASWLRSTCIAILHDAMDNIIPLPNKGIIVKPVSWEEN